MTLPDKKYKVLMVGSVPLSVHELTLAPAIIAAIVKKRGHSFEFLDINLELFKVCNRDLVLLQEKTELLQTKKPLDGDPMLIQWFDSIVQQIANCEVLLVNVFSQFSQPVASLIIDITRKQYPHIVIIVGGVGASKPISSKDSQRYGEKYLEEGLIDGWQKDIGTSEIERLLPMRISTQRYDYEFDFSIYDLDSYEWNNGNRSVPVLGSYGCVRQCSFCDVLTHFKKYSFIEADALSKHIVQIYEQTQISKFIFMDSLVNGSMSNFLNLLENLAHSKSQGWLPPDFSWSGTYICRPKTTLLDRIYKLLPKAGVDNLTIGVESGSDRVRFEMQKKFTNEDLLAELTAFERNSVKAALLFFPAWPTETIDDFNETLELFKNLAPFAQKRVIENVLLGTSGFGLISGTPIDDNKEEFGLEAGPTNFLWKCHTNPTLTFWETIRRRLLMADVCESLGIPLGDESVFRQFLTINLQTYRQEIIDYVGLNSLNLSDSEEYLCQLSNCHKIKMSIINSGTAPVTVTVCDSTSPTVYSCVPGTTKIELEFVKEYSKSCQLVIKFNFDQDYRPNWATHENGDYYSLNGIYIDNIYVDDRDITYYGFNQWTQQSIVDESVLPDDYAKHTNQRCVPVEMDLVWNISADTTLHKWILQELDPENYQQRHWADRKLFKQLDRFTEKPLIN